LKNLDEEIILNIIVEKYGRRIWGLKNNGFDICHMIKKAVPVTGRGDLQGCERSRLPHFLDNRLTDAGEVVSLTRRPPFTPRKIPGTHFC
jgi:hypothetical protein